ncbi:FAD-binding oxidoreductase [Actinomadura macrotermitis]|uniref:Putative FAD-linked oxidoreductase YvdP n=1 Tax=Actinomadura macrotermitis TaxID=2585200 RepID=A0A7K0BQG8_9ACTN|nr:FAD-binding protein [Actinomadura macrotermitis]MQY03425.1 putative FAD-linked oxidoreductase YvdP [Actinomadura macrotermitis]
MRPARRTFLLAGLAAAGCSSSPPPRKSAPPSSPVATTPAGPADWTALGRGLDGRLVRPGDAAYGQARRLYIPRFDRIRPAGIAYCANPQDVAECVAFAQRMRLPVAVRCGGHNYAGWSTGTGLVVDVSPMDRIRTDGERAVVGAGVRLIDLYADGPGVPAGTCPTVGVAGLTLGGGLGPMTRAHGLTCDALEAVRIVTADGRIRDCDAGRDADLLWASRGGGGGAFGVAVEFTFRTFGREDLTWFSARWPWSKAAAVISGWQRWAPPDELWSSLQLDTPSVEVVGVSLADPGKELDRLAGLAGGDPEELNSRRMPYVDAMKLLAGCAGRSVAQCHAPGGLPGQRRDGTYPRTEYAAKSHIAYRPLPGDAIDALVARLSGDAEGRSVLLDAMGGAVARLKPDETAFPHRAGLFCVQYLAATGDRDWLRGTHRAMEPHLGGAAYVNYADPELADWRRAYYGGNADRLARIKAAYDPGRLFRFPQAV